MLCSTHKIYDSNKTLTSKSERRVGKYFRENIDMKKEMFIEG